MYITKSNELSKIELDMSEYLEGTELASFIITIELKDINSTKIDIPKEAKESSIDLETYMKQYALINSGFGMDANLGANMPAIDTNTSIGGMDTGMGFGF